MHVPSGAPISRTDAIAPALTLISVPLPALSPVEWVNDILGYDPEAHTPRPQIGRTRPVASAWYSVSPNLISTQHVNRLRCMEFWSLFGGSAVRYAANSAGNNRQVEGS